MVGLWSLSDVRRSALCCLTCTPAPFTWCSADFGTCISFYPKPAEGCAPVKIAWLPGSCRKAPQTSSRRGTRRALIPAEKSERRAVSLNFLSSSWARHSGHSPSSFAHWFDLPKTPGFGLWHMYCCIPAWPFAVHPWSIAALRWRTPAASGGENFRHVAGWRAESVTSGWNITTPELVSCTREPCGLQKLS